MNQKRKQKSTHAVSLRVLNQPVRRGFTLIELLVVIAIISPAGRDLVSCLCPRA
jgi:prepilin-type N-terminal cleavage/methylation domain-containing protein